MDQRVLQVNETEHARRKYQGAVASDYDAKRDNSKKRESERAILRDLIAQFPDDYKILDIPCGTGFVGGLLHERGLKAVGMDVNDAMSRQAREGYRDIRYGDVLYIPLGNKSVDASFCIRLFNWISPQDMQRALRELQRVTRKQITFTLRVADHPRARPLELVQECLGSWHLARNDHIDDGKSQTFRMITIAVD